MEILERETTKEFLDNTVEDNIDRKNALNSLHVLSNSSSNYFKVYPFAVVVPTNK